jgi:hypothetical protein
VEVGLVGVRLNWKKCFLHPLSWKPLKGMHRSRVELELKHPINETTENAFGGARVCLDIVLI